jgi:hypothetical protein
VNTSGNGKAARAHKGCRAIQEEEEEEEEEEEVLTAVVMKCFLLAYNAM